MKRFLLTILISIFFVTSALAYPSIGARVRTSATDSFVKVVDFNIRNTTEQRTDGYSYIIRLYDRENREILNRSLSFQGYRPLTLEANEVTHQVITIRAPGLPVRVTVEVMLFISTQDGDLIIE